MNALGKDAEHEAKILDAYRDYVASSNHQERRERWTIVCNLIASRSAQQVLRMEQERGLR